MTHRTAWDDVAARITGMKVARKYTEAQLWEAHNAHPEIASLREAWLTKYIDTVLYPEYVAKFAKKKGKVK